MPTAGGPNTLGESNLVFAYDTGDTGNSYKGQPTVNVEASNIDTTFETIADGNAAGFNNQLGTGNYLGVSSNMGYRSSKSLRINRGSGGTGRIYKTYSVSTGQYSSVSCWVYSTTAGPFLALEYFGGDYSWGVGYTNNTHTGKGWELLYVRTTGPATSNTTGYYFLYTSIENQDIYLDNIQTELKQYPTSFVNGTRSAIQGLLPLIGTSTLDLSNVSFDSNAQIVFDGTNDYIDLGYAPFSGTGEFTIETVYTLNTTDTHTIIGNYPASSLQFMGRYGLYINGSCYFPSSLGPGTYYAVATRDVSGTCKLYLNGVLVNTVTNGNNIGTNSFRMGTNTGGGEVLNGKVPVMRLYNRALTAQEIQQNYQQYKTRFNLS